MTDNDNFDTNLDGDEIEVDFTRATPDRYSEHLSKTEMDEMDEIEVPAFWEADKELHELYSPESLDKAFKLIRNGKVKEAGRPGIYQVEGSELYVCSIIEIEGSKVPGVTCTCPNGSNRSGRPTCYHSAAVLMVHTNMSQGDIEMKLAGFPDVPPEEAP